MDSFPLHHDSSFKFPTVQMHECDLIVMLCITVTPLSVKSIGKLVGISDGSNNLKPVLSGSGSQFPSLLSSFLVLFLFFCK